MNATIKRLHEEYYVYAHDLQEHPALLDDYPHRHVYVAAKSRRTDAPFRGALPALFWAVEELEAKGWEAVTWHNDVRPGVVLRRRTPGADSPV